MDDVTVASSYSNISSCSNQNKRGLTECVYSEEPSTDALTGIMLKEKEKSHVLSEEELILLPKVRQMSKLFFILFLDMNAL